MSYDNMYRCNMNKSISSFTKESKNFATRNNRIIIEQSANCMRSQHKYSVSFHCKVSENSVPVIMKVVRAKDRKK